MFAALDFGLVLLGIALALAALGVAFARWGDKVIESEWKIFFRKRPPRSLSKVYSDALPAGLVASAIFVGVVAVLVLINVIR